MSKSLAEENFWNAWRMAAFPAYGPWFAIPFREYRFCAERLWLFDFAWPDVKLAVELEGFGARGVPGRHQRPKGFAADCEKYNTAVLLGWRVLRFPSKDRMHADRWVAFVKECYAQTCR